MFTRDQIEEIKKKLVAFGTKDTQLLDAHKLDGNEIVAIVQDGENRKIPLSSIIGLLSDISVTPNDDFINVSKDTTGFLTLSTAVSKVDINNRKLGQVITFKDSANSWAIRQFTGSSLDNWHDISLWKSISGIDELKSQADTNTSNISSLNTEVSTLQSKVDVNTTSISQINNTIADHEESIAQINTKLSEHTSNISNLGSAIEKNTSDIKNVSDTVDAQAARLDDVDTTLENALFKNKGYFTTLEKLNEAIPNPTIGSKAYVGTSEPYAIYIVENGAWVDSGYTGGDEIVAKITTDRIEDGAVTSEKIATSAFDSTLSVSGKIAPADVVGGKLNELGKEVIAQDISFEAGAVNYLDGKLISSGKSIRTDAIPISEYIRIIGYFNRTLNRAYIVKYLNGIYAGYEQISVSGMNIDQLLQKDISFDSFRLRVDVPGSGPDWSAQDILDSSASIYVQNSIAGKVETLSSSVQKIENKITSTPSSFDGLLTMQGIVQLLQRMSRSYFTEMKKAYVNLDELSVGSTFIFHTSHSSSYTFDYISVEEGDVIILTTNGNTTKAKSYAIMDADNKVLAIQQNAVTNVILVMPTGAKSFVANTITSTSGYSFVHIMGKTADYDSAVEQLHTFDRGKYSFISSGANVKLPNGPIPAGSTIIAVTGSDAVTSINLFDADGKNRCILPIDSLPYTTTIDYYNASTYISGNPLLTIVTGGIKDVIDGLQKGVSPDTGATISKKYRIGNHDNDFSFDNLFVGQLVASFLQLQRNFEIPCDGVCISTDVENVVILSEPVTDEQMLKANVPYLYIDGVKRGTIVLFDTDGTPFIYDNTGKKRYLTLS